MSADFQAARRMTGERYERCQVIRPEGTRQQSSEVFIVGARSGQIAGAAVMRECAWLLGLLLASALALTASRAEACGVSGVDGVSSCSLAEHNEALRPRWAV